MILEASVLGRVLGIRLLTVKASVVATPARIFAPSRVTATPREPAPPRGLPAAGAGLAPAPDRAIGSHLGQAMQYIDEGHASLVAARRDGRRGATSRPGPTDP